MNINSNIHEKVNIFHILSILCEYFGKQGRICYFSISIAASRPPAREKPNAWPECITL